MARLSAQDIRDMEFKQSALGYNREQVGEFLNAVADELENLTRELNELFQEHKEARLKLQTYANVEESLRETLQQAQATAQDALKNAREEARNILRKAQNEKDALLFSAKEDLTALQSDIRGLKAHRDEILTRLKSLLKSNLEVLEDVAREMAAAADPEDDLSFSDETIMDFSQADLAVEDLPREEPDMESPPDESVETDDDVFNIPEKPEGE